MALFDFLKVWASDPGNKTERSDAEIAAGWQEREVVRADEWNYQENVRDLRINANSADVRSVGTRAPAMTAAQLCARNHVDNQWADLSSTLHYQAVGADVIDSCVGWDATNSAAVVWILDENGLVRPFTNAWDINETPVLGPDIGLQYPSTVGGVLSMCCDADYLYVQWYRSTDGYICVSRYAAVGASFATSADWTYTSTEDYTAHAVPRGYRIIDALDGTHLALLWSRDSQPFCQVGTLTKDGLTASYGSGNMPATTPTLSQTDQLLRVVSNGDHLFWLVANDLPSERSTYVASASIADVTTSSYTFQVVGTLSINAFYDFPVGIDARHDGVNFVSASGRTYVYNLVEDSVDPVLQITPQRADTGSTKYGCAIGFDGLNHILASQTEDVVTNDNSLTFYRIPAGMTGPMSAQSSIVSVDYFADRTTCRFNNATGVVWRNMEYDGRSMWYVDQLGNVIRITNTGGR